MMKHNSYRRITGFFTKTSILLACILGVLSFFFIKFRLDTITVIGSKYYTEQELVDRITDSPLASNTLLFYLTHRFGEQKRIPYIEQMDYVMIDTHTMEVQVYEKILVGCVKVMGQYMYFDKDGYVTDSTNLTDEYARNKVRLQLLPLMQQINPAASANIARSATHLADAAHIYNKVIEGNCRHMVEPKDGGIDIDIASLQAVDAPETHLYEILAPYGFHARQVSDIYRSLGGESGRMFYTSEYMLLKDRQVLAVRPVVVTEAVEYTLPCEGTLELPDGVTIKVERLSTDDAWRVPKRADVLCIDAERLHYPLVMRHAREGDRFSPFGMRGTKLMSDFYTDLKMSLLDRQRQWLLCCGNDIVWAVGLRGSERYRIADRPKEIIMLTLV